MDLVFLRLTQTGIFGSMKTSQNKFSSLKHLPLNEVKVGMFVEKVFRNDSTLLFQKNELISERSQIEHLRSAGGHSVSIDAQKSLNTDPVDTVLSRMSSMSNDFDDDKEQREEAYHQELQKAIDVHHEGVVRATEVLEAVREGHTFSLKVIETVAANIVESILRNSDALVSLTQLKGYDNYTYVHSINVAILIAAVTKSMGYSRNKLIGAAMGGFLHDIGKMRVPESILNKPGSLTDSEFSIIKRHPENGLNAIIDKKGISDITKKVILQHHERFNGKGYPFGIKGERINEIGLISAVADVYDALTSERVYKSAWTPQKALACIFQERGSSYATTIVDIFTKIVGVYPVGSFVRLSSGEMGIVLRIEKKRLLQPTILILFDADGILLNQPYTIDLWEEQKKKEDINYKIEISLNPKTYNIQVEDYIQMKNIHF